MLKGDSFCRRGLVAAITETESAALFHLQACKAR
jgi:hypothetical protein